MFSARLFQSLLWCFPAPFRHEYGAEMVRAFSQELRAADGRSAAAAVWLRSIFDVLTTAPQEHYHVIKQDVRYALRMLAAQPGFTAVAVLSLALGIGANVALFSLIDSVLLRTLPVRDPEQLVMLTDPDSRGHRNGSQTDERSLLTYQEFEQLRDQTGVFANLMAVQSFLERIQVRINGSEPEEIRGQLASAEYFTTLGVPALMGRSFGSADGAKAYVAVISHAFWQRRLAGRADAIGTRLALRRGTFTVIGIMPPEFFGETVGQHPDVWFPMDLQPVVLPGRDWLHDDPASLAKDIWLHAIGRLKPGVTMAQAHSATSTVFQRGLEAYYASAPTEQARRRFLNQQVRLRPAGAGGVQRAEKFRPAADDPAGGGGAGAVDRMRQSGQSDAGAGDGADAGDGGAAGAGRGAGRPDPPDVDREYVDCAGRGLCRSGGGVADAGGAAGAGFEHDSLAAER